MSKRKPKRMITVTPDVECMILALPAYVRVGPLLQEMLGTDEHVYVRSNGHVSVNGRQLTHHRIREQSERIKQGLKELRFDIPRVSLNGVKDYE